jgi:hypothetical protein
LRESGEAFAALLNGFKGGETWSQHGLILAHIRRGLKPAAPD